MRKAALKPKSNTKTVLEECGHLEESTDVGRRNFSFISEIMLKHI